MEGLPCEGMRVRGYQGIRVSWYEGIRVRGYQGMRDAIPYHTSALLTDFWLARVQQTYQKVTEPDGKTVLNSILDHDDEYIVIHYLHFVRSTAQGGREYELKEGYSDIVLWEQGSVVPYKLAKAKMKNNQSKFVLSETHEEQILCRLQPIVD